MNHARPDNNNGMVDLVRHPPKPEAVATQRWFCIPTIHLIASFSQSTLPHGISLSSLSGCNPRQMSSQVLVTQMSIQLEHWALLLAAAHWASRILHFHNSSSSNSISLHTPGPCSEYLQRNKSISDFTNQQKIHIRGKGPLLVSLVV